MELKGQKRVLVQAMTTETPLCSRPLFDCFRNLVKDSLSNEMSDTMRLHAGTSLKLQLVNSPTWRKP